MTAKRPYSDLSAWRPDLVIDKLSGSDRLRKMVDADAGMDEIIGSWQAELAGFAARRQPYLLYW